MRLWDTDAISNSLKDPGLAARFQVAFLGNEVRVSAHTILELTAGRPTDAQKAVVASFLAVTGLVQVPEASDYHRAGEWLGKLPPRVIGKKKCPKCSAEIKPGKGEKKDARFRDSFDAILASVAWSRNWPVVTYNTGDFKQFQPMAPGGEIKRPEDALPAPQQSPVP